MEIEFKFKIKITSSVLLGVVVEVILELIKQGMFDQVQAMLNL
jgi:hypothetical protein